MQNQTADNEYWNDNNAVRESVNSVQEREREREREKENVEEQRRI